MKAPDTRAPGIRDCPRHVALDTEIEMMLEARRAARRVRPAHDWRSIVFLTVGFVGMALCAGNLAALAVVLWLSL
jgi:hypothetical protein